MTLRTILAFVATGLVVLGLSVALFKVAIEIEEEADLTSRWHAEAIWQISQTERALHRFALALRDSDDFVTEGAIYMGQGRMLPEMPIFGQLRFGHEEILNFGRQVEWTGNAIRAGNPEALKILLAEQSELLSAIAMEFAIRDDAYPDLFISQRSIFHRWFVGLLTLLALSSIAVIALYYKNAELRLSRAEEARLHMERLGLFAAGIVHEFNTRLPGLRWAFDRAIMGDPKKEAASAYALIDHMAELTGRLLLLARGTSHIRSEEFLIESFIERESVSFAEILGPGIRLESSSCRGTVFFDPVQLRSILCEAFANARDAMGGEGTVHLAYSRGRLTIRDTGPGIAKENLERCFEPSFTTKGTAGTGLGLAVIRNIVSSSGGKVTLENHKGGGTKLIIDFSAGET